MTVCENACVSLACAAAAGQSGLPRGENAKMLLFPFKIPIFAGLLLITKVFIDLPLLPVINCQ